MGSTWRWLRLLWRDHPVLVLLLAYMPAVVLAVVALLMAVLLGHALLRTVSAGVGSVGDAREAVMSTGRMAEKWCNYFVTSCTPAMYRIVSLLKAPG